MLEFRNVRREDAEWMLPIIRRENTMNADYSFVNIYAWGDTFAASAAMVEGCLVIRTVTDGQAAFSFPLGAESPGQALRSIDALYDFCGTGCFRMQSITAEMKALLEESRPGWLDFSPATDLFDYVYEAQKLAELAGKKLHSKRNFVNRFMAEHSWSFEPMDEQNLLECMDMDSIWVDEHLDAETDTVSHEIYAMQKALQDFTYLRQDGGVLRADGRIVAFTAGEVLSDDCYVVHFEKALPDVTGAYPMINREFVRHIMQKYPSIRYINREDDMGLENLRKAKRSYYPDFMVEKYFAKLAHDKV